MAEDARLVNAPPDSAAPDDRAAATDAAPTADAQARAATPVAVVTRRRKGHGRNGAELVECMHDELAGASAVRNAARGRIYDWVPRTLVRITGQAPLAATVYRLERLRCRLCDTVSCDRGARRGRPQVGSRPRAS